MLQFLRCCVMLTVVRPLAWLLVGVDVYGREHLPKAGPAIVAANHNSHLDTLLLLSLFRLRSLHAVRPVAAADHFMASPLSSWFSRHIVGVLPVVRDGRQRGGDVLADCRAALERGEILILFPEGTRGEAETMGRLKSGVVRLSEAFPTAPIVPVYIQGAGRVLPRGARIPVPFTCSIVLGAPFAWAGGRAGFMERLQTTFADLRADAPPLRWL